MLAIYTDAPTPGDAENFLEHTNIKAKGNVVFVDSADKNVNEKNNHVRVLSDLV